MAAVKYKIETIEDYDDDAITEAALNALSLGGWELKTVTYQPNEKGKSTATLIYMGSSSSVSSSSLSSSSSSSLSSSSSTSSSSSSSMPNNMVIGDSVTSPLNPYYGRIKRDFNESNWSAVRDGSDGSTISRNFTRNNQAVLTRKDAGGDYSISRTFLSFDLSFIPAHKKVIAVRIKTVTFALEDNRGIVVEGTQADPPTLLSLADYDAMGSAFSDVRHFASPNNTTTYPLDATGINYVQNLINNGYAKFCIRGYEYDYLDVAPPYDPMFVEQCGIYGTTNVDGYDGPLLEIDAVSSSSSSVSISSSSSSLSSSSSSSSLSSSSSSSVSSSSVSLSSSSRSSSLSSSSSSSESRSSSSVSSSSVSLSSVSSSSNSELPFMGSGWPYPPDQIQVTIGSRWNEGNVPFAEDDVITLIRVATGASQAYFTEDGTLTANDTTNRLRVMYQAGKMQAAVPNQFFSSLFYPVIDITHGYNPYDFGDAFNNSFSFTYYAYPTYFNVTTTDGFNPEAQYNGEVFKTFTFIDYSSSSSSSSSSSTSSSSSSSSSSNSDAPFMGTGWPYLPDRMEVTIGSRWIFANVSFVEDEVLTLKRVGEEGGDSIVYTESGESVAHPVTNRLKFRIDASGPPSVATKLWVYWSPERGGIFWTTGAYAAMYNVPYDFKTWFDSSPSFNTYADSDYFDVTTESSFSPYLYYKGEIFKTMTFIDFTSSSSSSTSSSSTSFSAGQLKLVDDIDMFGDIWGIWGDSGNFLYGVGGGNGIKSYSYDPSGNLTHIDTDDQGDWYYDTWGDGNFIYAANGFNGLQSYSVDSTGGLTHIDTVAVGDRCRGIWGDGNFLYVACDGAGLQSFSVDSTGGLTHIDTDDQGDDYYGVWGDGTYIYCACFSAGLRSYSADGAGNLTYIDTDDQGDFYQRVWGDGTFVYAACTSAGLRSYSVDGGGNLTYIDVDDQGSAYYGVWGDGTYIYAAAASIGLVSYTVDGGGNLTFVDSHYIGWGIYRDAWTDGGYIFVAGDDAGLLSYQVKT